MIQEHWLLSSWYIHITIIVLHTSICFTISLLHDIATIVSTIPLTFLLLSSLVLFLSVLLLYKKLFHDSHDSCKQLNIT